MERRKCTREFKLEAVKLVRERGVIVSQVARDWGAHGTVLRRWVREGTADLQQAFPGQEQMKPDQLEFERLRREVTRLKAELDILKKPQPTSRGSRCEVPLHRDAPGKLTDGVVMRGTRRLARWVLRVADAATQPAGEDSPKPCCITRIEGASTQTSRSKGSWRTRAWLVA